MKQAREFTFLSLCLSWALWAEPETSYCHFLQVHVHHEFHEASWWSEVSWSPSSLTSLVAQWGRRSWHTSPQLHPLLHLSEQTAGPGWCLSVSTLSQPPPHQVRQPDGMRWHGSRGFFLLLWKLFITRKIVKYFARCCSYLCISIVPEQWGPFTGSLSISWEFCECRRENNSAKVEIRFQRWCSRLSFHSLLVWGVDLLTQTWMMSPPYLSQKAKRRVGYTSWN